MHAIHWQYIFALFCVYFDLYNLEQWNYLTKLLWTVNIVYCLFWLAAVMIKLALNVIDCSTSLKNNLGSQQIAVTTTIGLYHPLDGITNLRYKLLCFLTPNKKIFK